MARIRTIKPEFFRHERLFEAEKNSGLPLRIAFAGLWTAADRDGRFVWSPRALKLDCLPYDDVDFATVLSALANGGFIIKYRIEGKDYGVIPSWYQHQRINQREAQSCIPAPCNESMCVHLQASETHEPARENPVPAPGEGKGREGKGTDICAVAGATAGQQDVLARKLFEDFWHAYPKREGANPKAPAKKKFLALLKSGGSADEIIAGAQGYAEEQRRIGKLGTSYIAQAVTWLNQQRWQDYEPKPEDAARKAELDRHMAERGYLWKDGAWQQQRKTAECLQ